MALLEKTRQLVVAPEQQSGVIPTTTAPTFADDLVNPAFAGIVTTSITPNFDVELFDLDLSTPGLTPQKQGVGVKAGGITAGFYLAPGQGGTLPPWATLMDICGFPTRVATRATIDAAAWTEQGGGGGTKVGPIRNGERVTDGTNSAFVMRDTHEGDTYLYIDQDSQTGALAAGAWTSLDTGVVFTVATVTANAGWGWAPKSAANRQITTDGTGTFAVGDAVQGATSGARATVVQAYAAGDTTLVFEPVWGQFADAEPLIRYNLSTATWDAAASSNTAAAADEKFTALGSASIRLNQARRYVDFLGSRGNIVFTFTPSRQVVATVTTEGIWADVGSTEILAGSSAFVQGPNWDGALIGLQSNEASGDVPWGGGSGLRYEDYAAELTPCLKSMSIDAGVQLNRVPCADAIGGIDEFAISGRSGTGSMVVGATLEHNIPWLTPLRAGEVQRFRTGWGSRANGNYFEFSMPGVQYTGATSGEDGGVLTNDMAFALTGGVNDNIDHDAPAGDISGVPTDNELVVILDVTAP